MKRNPAHGSRQASPASAPSPEPVPGARRAIEPAQIQRVTRSGVYAELSLLLAQESDPIRLVVNACAKAGRVLEFDRFGLLWLSAANSSAGTYYYTTPANKRVTASEIEITGSAVATVIRERTMWSFDGPACAEVMRVLHGGDASVSSVLVAPIQVSGRVLGAVVLASKKPRKYRSPDLELVRVLSVHLGSALHMERADQEVRNLASIVQSTDLSVIGYDRDARVTSWNAAAERTLGFKAAEILGKRMHDFIPEECRDKFRLQFATVLEGCQVEIRDAVRLTHTGKRVDISTIFSPVRDDEGRVVGVVEISRDITEHRRAEERFKLAVESAPSAMLMVDSAGLIVLVNGEAERLFDCPRDQIIGARAELFVPGGFQTDSSELPREPTRLTTAAGQQLVAVRHSGERVPVEVGLTPLETPEGLMVLSSIVDITERRKFEVAQAELMRRLKEAVEARDAFLSIASHELRTPLTALQLTVQSLLRRMRRGSDDGATPAERIMVKLDTVQRQVQRLSQLVDQLLDVSRIASGRLVLERQPCDIVSIAHEVCDRFFDEDDAARSLLHVNFPPALSGEWDRNRLDQILTNLIANALKYGENRPVEVQGWDAEDFVRMEVRDHGIGIAPEQQHRIFERFERLVSERHYGGFGLGLWIVRQFVEAHDGVISVTSEVGRGSTFTIVLPKRAKARAFERDTANGALLAGNAD